MIILIAGIWGALIPFVGPYFHFVLGPDQHWKWTTGRLWLNVLPGAVAALGGLILMGGGPRVSGRFGALMALAAGIWFIVGPDVSMLWHHGVSQAGTPHGRHVFKRFLEYLTFHSGLGALITTLAAYSLPGYRRHVVEREVAAAETGAALGGGRRRGRGVRDAEFAAGGAAAGAAAEHHHDRRLEEREAGAGGAGLGAGGGAGGAGAGATEPLPAREGEIAPGTRGGGVGAGGADEPTVAREGGIGESGGAGAPLGGGGGGVGTDRGGALPATGPGASRRRGGLLSRLMGRD